MDLGLEGRRALVTGGSSGIGQAAAFCLLDEGAIVTIAARDPRRLGGARGRAPHGSADRLYTLEMDVNDTASIEAGVTRAVAEMGGLDIVIHAAGGSAYTDAYRDRNAAALPLEVGEEGSWLFRPRLDDSDDSDWAHLYRLNVLSFVHLVRVARPALRNSDAPRVVAVSSQSGVERGVGQWDYHVAKAAEIAAAHCLAAELHDDRILVNAVCPGATDSDASRGLREVIARETGKSFDEVTETIWKNLPFQRAAAPEEIAAVVCFLASARASYVNGATVVVDGGKTMHLL